VDPVVNAALTSWNFVTPATLVLLLAASIYVLGWMRMRRLLRTSRDKQRLLCYLAGVALVFLAIESPLDAFDNLSLSAHMAQHLLLMMFAPPLILLSRPTLPLLYGLPRTFVKEGLGPFLSWPALKKIFGLLTAPPISWLIFALSTILWHLPWFYELALGSPFWHGLQHACFFWSGILFWWPVIRPVPGPSRWPAWIKVPYLLFADLVNTLLSAFFVFSGRLLYPSYASTHLGINPKDDQTIAGLIMWVPGSLVYLLTAFLLAMRLLVNTRERESATRDCVVRVRAQNSRFDVRSLARLRPAFQIFMLLLALLVILDGFFGPEAAPLNLAGVLPWIHWRALSIFALLIVGNIFCMSCPFVFVRDLGRKILPARRRWPRWLRNKWLSVVLLLLYLWAYEAFSLWDKPFVTAAIILGYFAAALLVDGLFRGASFCKYVCPIGQFQFVSSLVSPREIRIKRASICQSCQTFDCIRGNTEARGCELYLFQPKKAGNLDCTFCLDCVRACPHDNVSLAPVLPAKTLLADPYRSSLGRLSKRTDLAVLAAVFVFGAFANAAGMIAPVMIFEHRLHSWFGSMPAAIGLLFFAAVVLLPAITVSICSLLTRLSPVEEWGSVTRRFVFALVPVGFAMWAAHLLYHFGTGWHAPWAIVSQRFLTTTFSAVPAIPGWLPAAQIILLNAGLLITLYLAWRLAKQYFSRAGSALLVLVPWCALAIALYSAGIWILFQPMQMRGMMH
jgi:cytochrome c oxidase assembly factor CtaG/ferredoxin